MVRTVVLQCRRSKYGNKGRKIPSLSKLSKGRDAMVATAAVRARLTDLDSDSRRRARASQSSLSLPAGAGGSNNIILIIHHHTCQNASLSLWTLVVVVGDWLYMPRIMVLWYGMVMAWRGFQSCSNWTRFCPPKCYNLLPARSVFSSSEECDRVDRGL